jgi:hypothetical protein
MKIELANIVAELSKNGIEKPIINKIVEGLQAKVRNEADDEPKDKRKTQFVVVISDPEGKIKDDHVAWVGQIEEDAKPASFIDRIIKAAYDFNASKKGRLLPVKTIGEALESIPRKFYKVAGAKTLVKTKTPVLVITTNNEIPKG